VLGIVPLGLEQWALIAGIALLLLVAVEIGKWIRNSLARTNG
jgi:hypothetical protein